MNPEVLHIALHGRLVSAGVPFLTSKNRIASHVDGNLIVTSGEFLAPKGHRFSKQELLRFDYAQALSDVRRTVAFNHEMGALDDKAIAARLLGRDIIQPNAANVDPHILAHFEFGRKNQIKSTVNVEQSLLDGIIFAHDEYGEFVQSEELFARLQAFIENPVNTLEMFE